MLNKNEQSSADLGQVYHDYIEFINQLTIDHPLSILLLAVSDIVILADLLLQLEPENIFIKDLTYLGISSMLFSINQTSPILAYIFNGISLLLLLSPFLALLHILYHAYSSKARENGQFKEIFQKSMISKAMRGYFISFAFIFLPVLTSYGAKIISLGGANQIFGIVFLILLVINMLVIEYHIFELGNEGTTKAYLVPLNYPYHMVDSIFVFVALICINLTSGATSQIVGVIAISLRLALTLYTPFYSQKNQKYYEIIVVSSLIGAIGLLVSYYNVDRIYNLLLIVTLIAYLLYIKNRTQQVPLWQRLKPLEPEAEELQTIKTNLNNNNLFVKSFRSLIFLGRHNKTHRTLLQIEINKSKCYAMEKIHRGGNRMCGARDVLKFQDTLLQFMTNFLSACELSVSLLKFMQSKEGRKQILAKQVTHLVNMLYKNKRLIKQLLMLNEYSYEVKFLLFKTYGQMHYDTSFIKQMQHWLKESTMNDNQKELKERLYNEKSVVVFINILEEIGKVVKISKNLPTVLGYEPTNLLGLSINQIIPFSVKTYHDQHLLDFLQRYSNKEPISRNQLKFYAYNSEFHLQEIIVRYSWVMHDFNAFHLAGIIEKVQSDTHVILTDQCGNLQGWTKKIGGEQFNLDSISINERKKFNIMPLFPTLIKYMDSLGVVVRTIFFKNAKPRDPHLIVVDSSQPIDLPELQAKLLKTFMTMVKEEEMVGACFAEIQFFKVSLCQGRANMRQIVIREFQNLENLSEITTLISRLNSNHGFSIKTDKSLVSCNELNGETQRQERSIFSEENKADKKIDSNFTLSPEGQNFFPYQQLVFGQFNSSKTTFQISNVCQQHIKKKTAKIDQNNACAQVNFNYTLHKHSTLLWYVLIVTIIVIVLFTLNLVAVSNAGNMFEQENKNIISRNKAASIYLKSIFNPNASYISRFANGSLLQNMDYLYYEHFDYQTFLGDVVKQNQYYMFNTQIPATLQRLITNPLQYSNQTVDIIPPTNADYYREITYNYQGVVNEYHRKFSDALTVWSQNIEAVKMNFFIRFAFLCICTLVYIFLLVLLFYRERRHKQTLQAFFKFQKEDLQNKIAQMGVLVKDLEGQASQLNLIKEFSEIVKRQQITNVDFSLIKNVHNVKIGFEHDQEAENNIQQRRYNIAVLVISLFLILQVIFLILHAVLSLQALTFYSETPQDLDNAAKLIVLPNFLLADIYLELPASIKAQYGQLVNTAMAAPISTIPELYPFLGTVPCTSCLFMYPVLTTNYKSFYSTFQQQAVEVKNSNSVNNTKVQDLFFAADYVAQTVIPVLLASSYSYADISIVVYLISLLILCLAIHIGSSSINAEIQRLEVFLRFFSQETITKNKHMSRLFNNFE